MEEVEGGGGGGLSAGRGGGFDRKVKISVKFLRVGYYFVQMYVRRPTQGQNSKTD